VESTAELKSEIAELKKTVAAQDKHVATLTAYFVAALAVVSVLVPVLLKKLGLT